MAYQEVTSQLLGHTLIFNFCLVIFPFPHLWYTPIGYTAKLNEQATYMYPDIFSQKPLNLKYMMDIITDSETGSTFNTCSMCRKCNCHYVTVLTATSYIQYLANCSSYTMKGVEIIVIYKYFSLTERVKEMVHWNVENGQITPLQIAENINKMSKVLLKPSLLWGIN